MFTPKEAEQILREQWDDASMVGGFSTPFQRGQTLQELTEKYGEEALKGWTLIGETSWTDYEEGGVHYLFVKDEDDSLWSLAAGHTVYGDYGETFDEIAPANVSEWLEQVKGDEEHNANFVGF